MTDHDPLCHAAAFEWHDPECCDCALIAKVVERERERNREADGVAAYLAAEDAMVDLRARAEALPIAHHYGGERGWCVRIADVIALFDGSE